MTRSIFTCFCSITHSNNWVTWNNMPQRKTFFWKVFCNYINVSDWSLCLFIGDIPFLVSRDSADVWYARLLKNVDLVILFLLKCLSTISFLGCIEKCLTWAKQWVLLLICIVQLVTFTQDIPIYAKHVRQYTLSTIAYLCYLLCKNFAEISVQARIGGCHCTTGLKSRKMNTHGGRCAVMRSIDNPKKTYSAFVQHRLNVASSYFHLYRIDHIVGFFRVWGIPQGRPAVEGSYIPEDESLWIPQGTTILDIIACTMERCSMYCFCYSYRLLLRPQNAFYDAWLLSHVANWRGSGNHSQESEILFTALGMLWCYVDGLYKTRGTDRGTRRTERPGGSHCRDATLLGCKPTNIMIFLIWILFGSQGICGTKVMRWERNWDDKEHNQPQTPLEQYVCLALYYSIFFTL